MSLILNMNFSCLNEHLKSKPKHEILSKLFEKDVIKLNVNEIVWGEYFSFKERPNIHTIMIEFTENYDRLFIDFIANDWQDEIKRVYGNY